jgi:hypothetical protein
MRNVTEKMKYQGKKRVLVPLNLSQVPLDLTRNRTRGTAVESQEMKACAMVRLTGVNQKEIVMSQFYFNIYNSIPKQNVTYDIG